jgi:hypothetical protein
MCPYIQKIAFIGSVVLISLLGTANAAPKSETTNIPDPTSEYVLAGVWGEKGDGCGTASHSRFDDASSAMAAT